MTACCPLCGADALYAMLLAAAANLAETRDTEAARGLAGLGLRAGTREYIRARLAERGAGS